MFHSISIRTRRLHNLYRSFKTRKCINVTSFFRYHSSGSFGEEREKNTNMLMSFPPDKIRNFSIIAHIDHGKSTLADRILEMTGAISKDDINKQVLDKLQVERERGITVKAQSASLIYTYKGEDYLLNLIDTPGHVDFSYEVSRSLAACDGVVLLVDANQGVQAQTVANFHLADGLNLKVIPVLNKVDLKNADTELVTEQMMVMFDTDPEDVLKVSAKTGFGVKDVIESVIERIPAPDSSRNNPFRCLLFDSWFHRLKGAIGLVMVKDGTIKVGDYISSCQTSKNYEVKDMWLLTPTERPVTQIFAGQLGCVAANIKTISEAQVGDTFHHKKIPVEPIQGFKPCRPMVFAGVYPMSGEDLKDLKSAIEKLTLNDASVTVTKEISMALGQGWRLGFLGLLHMDVFNQRLDQEFGAQVVITTPTVPYIIQYADVKATKHMTEKKVKLENPAAWPDNEAIIVDTFEPMVIGTIITPEDYVNDIYKLCDERRGVELSKKNIDDFRVVIKYRLPLNEIIVDFFDYLKSVSSGYASFDYEDDGYDKVKLIKLMFLLNEVPVEELTCIIPEERVLQYARKTCLRLTQTIPKQLFRISVQGVIGKKIIAREDIKALRKDVLAKCYGGDVTRKMKLLKQQKEGKKQMRMYGKVEVPRDTFINILKR